MANKNTFKKSGKLFGVISIIDIIVVLCIIVLAFGVYARFTSDSDAVASSNRATIEYVYMVKGVRNFTCEALEKGGAVYDSETKEYIGDVKEVRSEPAKMEVSLVNGEYRMLTLPDMYDVYVTITVDGKYNSLGYYTSDNRFIGAGSTLLAQSKFATTEGEIVEARDVEQ